MSFGTKVDEPFEVWAMKVVQRSRIKLLRHMRTNSRCVNFCGHTNVKPLHLAMNLVMSISFVLHLNQFRDTYPSVTVAKLFQKLMFHYLSAHN